MSSSQVVVLDSDSEPDDPHVVRLDSDSESDASLTIVREKVVPVASKGRMKEVILPLREVDTLLACFRKRKPFTDMSLRGKVAEPIKSGEKSLGTRNDHGCYGKLEKRSAGPAMDRLNACSKGSNFDWLHDLRSPVVADGCHREAAVEEGVSGWEENPAVAAAVESSPETKSLQGNRQKKAKSGTVRVSVEERAQILADKRAEKEAEKQRKLEARALEKTRKEEERKARLVQSKQRREEEKLRRERLKLESAERKKLEQEKNKWDKGKFAIENTVAYIDTKVVEKGSIGGPLLTRLGEKNLRFQIVSNPIKKTVIWSTKRPSANWEGDSEFPGEETVESSSQIDPCRSSQLQLEDVEIPYVLVILDGEEFSKMVAENDLHKHVQSIQQHYPGFTVCYLVNKLMRFLHQMAQAQYKRNDSSWDRPPVEQALARFVTHYAGVHSRLCLDEAEVADHIVGLMQSLAIAPFKEKLTALSVSKNGEHVAKDDANRALIRKSTWLKALVALPKLSGSCAIAIAKKYPNMRALLNAYQNPNMTVHEKEFLLQDLLVEGPLGTSSARSRRLGPVCSRRVYRIFTAQNGNLKIEDVEEGADLFE